MARPRIGELLVNDKIITQEQLDEALRVQQQTNNLIGLVFIELGYINRSTLEKYLVIQSKIVIASDAKE